MKHRFSRRDFLGQCVSVPLASLAPSIVFGRSELPSRVSLVEDTEPGEPLTITGTVYRPDSRTPAPGIRLDVYHTDFEGYYSRPVNNPRQARIRGSICTDSNGRYEIRTIHPGHYTGQAAPPSAHIHVHVSGSSVPHHWIDSFLFENDPFLRADDLARGRELGAFTHVMRIARDGGGRRAGVRNIRLDETLFERNRLLNGWYKQ